MDSISAASFKGSTNDPTIPSDDYSEKDILLIFNAAVSLMTATAINGTLRLKPPLAVNWAAATLGIARSPMPKDHYKVARTNPAEGLAFIKDAIAEMKSEQEAALKREIEIEEEEINRAREKQADS